MANDSENAIEDLYRIANPAQVKAYLHHQRLAILERLANDTLTLTQLAMALGVPPANLTRHVHRLEQVGLIRLVEKRDTGRNLEKYYRAVARRFELAPGSRGQIGIRRQLALGVLADDLALAAGQVSTAPADEVRAWLWHGVLGPEALAEAARRLQELADWCRSQPTAGGKPVTLNASLYPSAGQSGLAGTKPQEDENEKPASPPAR